MEKENFIKTVNAYHNFLENADRLEELGIDLYDGPITNSMDIIFDSWLQAITNDEGSDLIYWWLFEDVDKVITYEDKEYNVEDIEELFKYMNENGYFKA